MYNTPMPIIIHSGNHEPDICPSCNKDESIKKVCKHCGYEYPEPESNSSKFGWIGISILSFAIICVLGLFFVMFLSFRTDVYNNFFISSDCKYTLPKEYKLMYNEENKTYIVQFKDKSGYSEPEYLYTNYHFNIDKTPYLDINEPAEFSDSCAAKGYVKTYIEQMQEDSPVNIIKGYEPIQNSVKPSKDSIQITKN